MTKIERAVHDMFISCVDGQFTDAIDLGEWIINFGGKDFVVEYLPAEPGHHTRLTLSDQDASNDDYTVKHKFIVEVKITEVKE